MFKYAAYTVAMLASAAKFATGFVLFGLCYLWLVRHGHEGQSTVFALGCIFGIGQMAFTIATNDTYRNDVFSVVLSAERFFRQEMDKIDNDR
jgi:hypothetical protein